MFSADDDDDDDEEIFGAGSGWYMGKSCSLLWDRWDALSLAAFCRSWSLLISAEPLDCLRILSLCAFASLCAFVWGGIFEYVTFYTSLQSTNFLSQNIRLGWMETVGKTAK